MGFFIIKGAFYIRGYSPDGDSIRFKADNKDNWGLLSGPPVSLNAREHAQLRLEAIDTLETHYLNFHQPLGLAHDALDFLLSNLGFKGVLWDEFHLRVTDVDNDGVPGFIISRTVEPNRRPVSFIFAGEAAEDDGSEIFLTAGENGNNQNQVRLENSLNYQSILNGMAYPTYYQGLFSDLRIALSNASAQARAANAGVWAQDRTNAGFDVNGIQSITDQHVILPKLFRRLAEYLQGGGNLNGFLDFLELKDDGVTVLSPTAHFTHLDDLIEINGNTVRMTEPPENLMFEG
jgi:endonuclease YncB( thermonuclease family)